MNFTTVANPLINSKIMEWTNDDALELIEQYRCHTELWNRADPKYKDKLCRFRAWSEIAERFGCSKAEVERKMNVLLTQYRREKHKMLLKLYQGIQPNPSKWYAFKRFDFMEAGGGSGGGSGSSSGGGVIMNSGTNGHTTVAAAAAALNGLGGFDTTAGGTTIGATALSHHRRMKSKEMKYFGAMGLNLPMLIANTQTLDTWNSVGQFSPPIGERGHLRVPLPMPFSASQNDMSAVGAGTRSLFGSSSNSDLGASPQKPMETADIDDKEDTKHERTSPSNMMHDSSVTGNGSANTLGTRIIDSSTLRAGGSSSGGGGSGGVGGGGGGGGVGGGGSNVTGGGSGADGTEGGSSSPIPNTNTLEAHRNRHEQRDQDDLDIKQELVDYFHAPHPPAPPGSHHSYSSTDDNRLGGGGADSDDFAQDLRVSAAAAAAAKSLDFSHFVLPRSLRHSSESIDEKFSPLNMRKLNVNSSAASATAGQMLMNSLLSNESISEDTTTSGRHGGSVIVAGVGGGGGGGLGKNASQEATNSAAAAAAAIYAESLNKDDCDFIGSNVTLKLRSMDRTQRIIAEKLISEVLFYGQFNELERSARIQPK
ncbi:uncharacterized transmembrane protein DDB_G0289901 [Teleopsis dalmanni]|uniref:uncharacterized transmembrane protein DDB_G0289901 n=1 Tax=Teleopsis dalmanni TaxID=139649 RepID=UPI0018CE4D90|nr:uncharacterized transmembrane protein DDB_G0289901 [Teleopsis dalmanni]XP_037958027.1 uncharacterized transmembrane protein DDB_G0289901 [Teleopsis dalmanni]XP_037958028.1 uncharacterized transmembrane protein DDB_G0289901 [Teleopsis dalmanni]